VPAKGPRGTHNEPNRAGRYVRQAQGYSAFYPASYPPGDLRLSPQLLRLLSRADLELGKLVGAAEVLPNPDLFVRMYVRREAVLSSQIEGTQASLMDVLENEAVQDKGEREINVSPCHG
jgi:Fic family protein